MKMNYKKDLGRGLSWSVCLCYIRLASHAEGHRGRLPEPGLRSWAGGEADFQWRAEGEAGRVLEAWL